MKRHLRQKKNELNIIRMCDKVKYFQHERRANKR